MGSWDCRQGWNRMVNPNSDYEHNEMHDTDRNQFLEKEFGNSICADTWCADNWQSYQYDRFGLKKGWIMGTDTHQWSEGQTVARHRRFCMIWMSVMFSWAEITDWERSNHEEFIKTFIIESVAASPKRILNQLLSIACTQCWSLSVSFLWRWPIFTGFCTWFRQDRSELTFI